MSYCVSCGVELSDYQEKCPLCQTPVVNPNITAFNENDDYPEYRMKVHDQEKRVRRIMTGIILAVQFIVYALILLMINLLVNKQVSWSVIPMLSLLLLLFCVAWPFFKKRNTFFRLFTYDSMALAIYLFALNLIISGNIAWAKITGISILWVWIIIAGIFLTNRIRRFLPVTIYYVLAGFALAIITVLIIDNRLFAFYMIAAIAVPSLVISLITYFVIKSSSKGAIGMVIILLISVSLLSLLIDGLLNHYLNEQVKLTWSLIVIAVTLPIASTFYAVNMSREFKSVISRKLHR